MAAAEATVDHVRFKDVSWTNTPMRDLGQNEADIQHHLGGYGGMVSAAAAG